MPALLTDKYSEPELDLLKQPALDRGSHPWPTSLSEVGSQRIASQRWGLHLPAWGIDDQHRYRDLGVLRRGKANEPGIMPVFGMIRQRTGFSSYGDAR